MINLIKILLLPFVPFYALAASIRNKLFDLGIFRSKGVNAKVISVGNITMGGSGKTPMVIYLLNLLKKEGKKAGVLSRGYRRKSRGYLLVSRGEQILMPVSKCGDEIYHTVLETKVPAAVSENRVKGAGKLLEDTDIDIIVLDDAYQHRWIKRDINLLVCEQSFLTDPGFMDNFPLPSGKLRESFKGIKRADAIIINRKFNEKKPVPEKCKAYLEDRPVFTACYKAKGFYDLVHQTHYSLEDFSGQRSLVISGIANPYSFINALKMTNVETSNRIIFWDHVNYTLHDIEKIRKKFYSSNAHSVVTTEKDAVKLSSFSRELDDIDVFYLKIALNIDQEKAFEKFIMDRLIQGSKIKDRKIK